MAGIKLKGSGSSLENLSLPAKLAVGVLLTLLAGAAYFVIFYGEVAGNIDSQRQAIDQKRTELEKAEQAKTAYNSDLAEKARREGLARKQKKILPDDAEMPAFLQSLQNVATISGVTLTGWTPLDEVPEQFYARVPMQLKIEGRYHQIAKFFNQIGQADRIINMENIVVAVKNPGAEKPVEGEPEAPTVQVECLATAFRTPSQAEGGDGAGAGRHRTGGGT
jgi:type IV pilus assembly protein PilO